jgi:hypothetical protein
MEIHLTTEQKTVTEDVLIADMLWSWRRPASDSSGASTLLHSSTSPQLRPLPSLRSLVRVVVTATLAIIVCRRDKSPSYVCKQGQSMHCFTRSSLTVLESYVSTQRNAGSRSMDSRRNTAVPFHNPYDVLGTVVEAHSDGSGPSSSPTLSGSSVSQNSGGNSTAMGTTSRGSVSSGSQGTQQHRVSRR